MRLWTLVNLVLSTVISVMILPGRAAALPREDQQGSPSGGIPWVRLAESSLEPTADRVYLEPELYATVKGLEEKLAGGQDGYWPDYFSLVEDGEHRYAVVTTRFFGSGSHTFLVVSGPGHAWQVLGSMSRMGEQTRDSLTTDEASALGLSQLPPGVWNALGRARTHVFNREIDEANQAYEDEQERLEEKRP